jgi:predicted DCC family thiol-disulfide oxidoreductase YuxK
MTTREKEFEIDAIYDGECLTCGQQVELLRESDVNQCIHFVETSAPGFDVERDAGIPIDRAMDCIQARLASGEVVQGVQALRLLREATGNASSAIVTVLPSTSRLRDVPDPGIDLGVNLDVDYLECRKVARQISHHGTERVRRSSVQRA